jgi:L-aminopeptidase/D-esterase-like protein
MSASSIKVFYILLFMGGLLGARASQAQVARDFSFDFPEIKVGIAENLKGPTGCTVLSFPAGALAAVDVRGGAAAVREQSSIEEANSWGWADAVVLAGGSTYGLAAADGVMAEILKSRGDSVKFDDIPAVPAAIVYDFGRRENAIYPDAALGAEAFRNAVANKVRVGPAGAGINVKVGGFFGREWSEKSGQGAAFYAKDGLKIFALTVVNAMGNVVADDGSILAGSKDPKTGERVSVTRKLLADPTAKRGKDSLGNTTISVVVFNQPLERGELKRLAIMAHTAMGRAIEPFHGPGDGDVLFAVSTVTKPSARKEAPELTRLGVLAGGLLQDAVRQAVRR